MTAGLLFAIPQLETRNSKLMPSNNIPRPRVACEISAERVVAGRAGEGAQALEAVSAQSIPDGALIPGLQQANVTAREALVLSLIHISEPTRRTPISYAVFCLKKKKH